MDKAQAIDKFWNSFDIPAYDENTVPKDAKMPYITYSVTEDNIDYPVSLTASIWYNSTSWREITLKTAEIAKAVKEMMPPTIKLDNGRLYIAMASPYAQRMNDPESDSIRRMLINLQAQFLTDY